MSYVDTLLAFGLQQNLDNTNSYLTFKSIELRLFDD